MAFTKEELENKQLEEQIARDNEWHRITKWLERKQALRRDIEALTSLLKVPRIATGAPLADLTIEKLKEAVAELEFKCE